MIFSSLIDLFLFESTIFCIGTDKIKRSIIRKNGRLILLKKLLIIFFSYLNSFLWKTTIERSSKIKENIKAYAVVFNISSKLIFPP